VLLYVDVSLSAIERLTGSSAIRVFGEIVRIEIQTFPSFKRALIAGVRQSKRSNQNIINTVGAGQNRKNRHLLPCCFRMSEHLWISRGKLNLSRLKATKIAGEELLPSLFDEPATAAIKIDPVSDESNNPAE
jgi:hypothetical protein